MSEDNMDRRAILKGFGSVMAWSSALRSRLFPPVSENKLAPGFGDAGPQRDSALTADVAGASTYPRDIRDLSHHFINPRGDIAPWIFVPENNVNSASLTEHPGFVTVSHADKGKDIKGILKDPIRIDDYPLPWEFHLGL